MNARILLVEDDPVSCDLIASLLVSRGYQVDSACDGFSGLRLAQDNAYDLVFVDYHLPEMDGYAFARLMRSLAERGGWTLHMVAITADQFGLAARRGADAVFDRLLPKPIDPDALYACTSAFITEAGPQNATLADLDLFLSEPGRRDAQSASQVLWRVRGLAHMPRAVVFPEPSADEHEALRFCFTIVPPAEADCILLLDESGLAGLSALRQSGPNALLPVIAIGELAEDVRDGVFEVGDAASWTAVATAIQAFQRRSARLKTELRASGDVATRMLAHLYVSGRPFVLRRDPLGQTRVVYDAGFEPHGVIAALKTLAAKSFVTSRLGDPAPDGSKELSVLPSERGQAFLLQPGGQDPGLTGTLHRGLA